MSAQLMSAALDAQCGSGAAKLILLIFSDMGGDAGIISLSIDEIATKTELVPNEVIGAIESLEARGLLEVRRSSGGQKTYIVKVGQRHNDNPNEGPPWLTNLPVLTEYEHRRRKANAYTKRPRVRATVFARHGQVCVHCGSSDDICLDHVVPVAAGGPNAAENLQPLCRRCNSTKGRR